MTALPTSRRGLLKLLAIGAVGGSGLSSVAAADSVLAEEDLIARWPLEENYEDIVGDNSASADHGNPTLGTYDDRTAVAFDGDDGLRVSQGENADLDLMGEGHGPVTFSMWVYIDEELGADPQGDSETPGHTLLRNDTNFVVSIESIENEGSIRLHPRFRITSQGNPDAVNYNSELESTDEISLNEWHHLAVIADSTNYVQIYIDNEIAFSDTSVDGYNAGASDYWSDVTIGSWYGRNPAVWANLMNGKLSDIRIYEKALSENEIEGLYTAGGSDTQTQEAEFSTGIASLRSPIEAGETLTVLVDLENTGNESDKQTIRLESSSGEIADTKSVSLAEAETTTIALAWETDTDDNGESEVAIRSDDDAVTDEIIVEDEQDQSEDEEDEQDQPEDDQDQQDNQQPDEEKEQSDEDEEGQSDNQQPETELVVEFTFSPEDPEVGERVAFDASSSTVTGGQIEEYSWEFDDGETATGEQVTHTFEETGGYNVIVSIIDDQGSSDQSVEQIDVSSDSDTASGSEDSVPGFGIGSSLASLGGGAYLLKHISERGQ